MKHTTLIRLMGLAGLSSVIAASAFAQQQQDKYFYGGISAGQSLSQMNEQDTTRSLIGGAPLITGFGHDERDAAYKLFGGYQFNRNIALEGGYFNLGTFNFTSLTTPAGVLNGGYKVDGWNVDLVGTLPLGQRWSLLGRIGAQYAQTNGSYNGTGAAAGANFSREQSETNAKVGLGLQYEISQNVLLRGEVERYRLNDGLGNHGGANTYTVGLVFPFGRTAAPAPRPIAVAQAPAPAPYVAPPPPPPPPPAPLPPPPAPRRVTFSADSLFDFDKSDVKPEGRAALDKFSRDLRNTQYDVVTVEGNTDRLGSDAYNMKLSERRATAVKDYLVSSGGVPAAKISSVGKGETNPVTKPEDCKGNKANPKLIACLQPDRRVEVVVTGLQR